jgi:hypothetical protein
MARTAGHSDVPEFHIVVRRPSQRGPLAPYRFAISLVVAVFVSFDDLRAALLDGGDADAAMLRALVAGVFTWIVLSVLNRVLATSSPGGASSGDRPATPD